MTFRGEGGLIMGGLALAAGFQTRIAAAAAHDPGRDVDDGKPLEIIMRVPKNGFFYVVDRLSIGLFVRVIRA